MIVGALVVVVASGAFMLNLAVREQHRDAHRYHFGEVATNVAESGLNLATEHLFQAAVLPGAPLHQALVASRWDEASGASVTLESEHLTDLVGFLGEGASAELSIELRNFRPLLRRVPLRGIAADLREKQGDLAVVCRAEYRGVVRTMVLAKRVKVVDVAAPVVSKFTLFVRERGDEDPNLLRYERTLPEEGYRIGELSARPWVLYHTTDRHPASVDGRFHALADELLDAAPDSGGLVYLGGREPWQLNLTHGAGAGRYEELFQLRRTRYAVEPRVPGFEHEWAMFFGFYEGLFRSEKFGDARSAGDYVGDPRLGRVRDRTAALHLWGDLAYVSPTVVLGPVFRRYVTLRLLDGYWFPTLSEAEFRAHPLRETFGGDYPAYARGMTRVVAEAYNRTWDYVTTNHESLGPGGQVEAGETPAVPPADLAGRVTRVRGAGEEGGAFLYPELGTEFPGVCRLVREVGGEVEPVFEGTLADLDGSLLADLLTKKAVATVPDEAAFFARHLRGRTLDVPGIVHVTSGGLELGAVNVRAPSMILVEGDVRIVDRIVEVAPRSPLTIVSLNGSIEVVTGAKVDAALVALNGTFRSKGKLELVGGVAAGRLELPAIVRGEAAKTLTYNEELDPTDDAYWNRLRVVSDPVRRMYLAAN